MAKPQQQRPHPTPIVRVHIAADGQVAVNNKTVTPYAQARSAFETATWYIAQNIAIKLDRPVQTYVSLADGQTERMNISPDAKIEWLPINPPTRPVAPLARGNTPRHRPTTITDDEHDTSTTDGDETRAPMQVVPDTDTGTDLSFVPTGDEQPAPQTHQQQTGAEPRRQDSHTAIDDRQQELTATHTARADYDNPARRRSRHHSGVQETPMPARGPSSTTTDTERHQESSAAVAATDPEPASQQGGFPAPFTADDTTDSDRSAGHPADSDGVATPAQGSVQAGAPTREATRLDHADLCLTNPAEPVTHSRIRQLLRLGPNRAERAQHDRLARIQKVPTTGSTFVGATFQMKGGNAKTTVAMLTAQAIAENTGLSTVVVSADPANGNLLQRAVNMSEAELMAHPTAIDLYNAERAARNQGHIGLTDAHMIGRHLALAGRLRVLGARQLIHDDSDDTTDTGLKAHQVDTLIQVLSRVHDVVIFDCGTGMTTAAFKTLLRLTHGAILVTNPSWDALDKGQQTLDFIEHRRDDILARSTIACVDTPTTARRNPTSFDRHAAISRLGNRLNAADPTGFTNHTKVIHVPYDFHIADGTAIQWPHLQPQTRHAALDLGGHFADTWSDIRSWDSRGAAKPSAPPAPAPLRQQEV